MRHGYVIVVSVVSVVSVSMLVGCVDQPADPETTEDGQNVQVQDTSYPVPTGAYFVAKTGKDNNPGTQTKPFLTIAHALAAVPAGSTIIVRAGAYHESISAVGKQVTLQPYPHEQVWMKGSVVVSTWTKESSPTVAWRHDNWTNQLCHGSCVSTAAIVDPSFPMAGYPDQVFVDGMPGLKQVGSRGAVRPGTFYVDNNSHKLYVGSDPAGHTVESSDLPIALQLGGAASGSVVRGIGIAQYGSNQDYSHNPAAVIVTGSNITLEANTIIQSAGSNIAAYGASMVLRNNYVSQSGFNGVVGNNSDNILVEGNTFSYANLENFLLGGSASGAAGVKLCSAHGLMIRDNVFDHNTGAGLWLDVSDYNATIIRNLASNNVRNGIFFEISGTAVIASNVLIDNQLHGVKISGSTNVRIFNNTFVHNESELGIYEDPRHNTNSSDLALGITWDTANVAVENNLFSNATGANLVYTVDASTPDHTDAAHMITAMDYNGYYRTSSASPATLVDWARLGTSPAQYQTFSTFASGTGREAHGIAFDNRAVNPFFVDVAAGDYHVASTSAAYHAGTALPSEIASALGVGGPVSMGAIAWPGSSTTPTGSGMNIALHEAWSALAGDHFYTADPNELAYALAVGYVDDGVKFHVATAPQSGLNPVYRLFNSGTGDHFYTIDANERDAAINQFGYTLETVAFYASTSQGSGEVPVYRLYGPAIGDHMYTDDPAARDAAVEKFGYRYEQIAFYVAP
jgi:parallel beta-helix repeat protein